MKKTIIIKGKPFYYDAIHLTRESAPILTFEQAKDILFTTKDLLEERGVRVALIYGTLLGAVRDKSFISHDFDVDVYTSQIEELTNAIPYLYEHGLKICRFHRNRLYSFEKDGIYIDIYLKSKAPFPFNIWCCSLNGHIMPAKFLAETEYISFLGKEFLIPKNPERLLEFFYGKTWTIPIKGDTGRCDIKLVVWYQKFKRFIQKVIGWYKWRHYVKRKYKTEYAEC